MSDTMAITIGLLFVLVIGVVVGRTQGREAQYVRERRERARSAANLPAAARIRFLPRGDESEEPIYLDAVPFDDWEILQDRGYARRHHVS